MKRLILPIAFLAVFLFGMEKKREAAASLTRNAANAAMQAQQRLNSLNSELQASRATIAARQAESDARRAFLMKWRDADRDNHRSIDERIRKLSTTRQVELIAVDQITNTVQLGEQSVKVRLYTRGFQGGYSNLLRFLGDFETSFELSSVESITFTKSLQQDLQMSLIFAVPDLTFGTAPAK